MFAVHAVHRKLGWNVRSSNYCICTDICPVSVPVQKLIGGITEELKVRDIKEYYDAQSKGLNPMSLLISG